MSSIELSTLIGGLGLFLLGMAFMTDGLKSAAGHSLSIWLQRSTKNRFSAIATGLIFTAAVQSSSATTLAAIGFVNAGLLDLVQTIGVIYGANLGTTLTVWMISLVGVKVSASVFALPCVGIGSLLKIFTRGRIAAIGVTIAGFGLVFHGIDLMQAGMASGESFRQLGGWSADNIAGRLGLAGIGVAMTIVMQSSSAALAITLAAVSTGTLSLADAAALAIGQNVGTTATAVIASLHATANARRTAAAHVLFNVLTGLVALFLFSPLLDSVEWTAGRLGAEDTPTMLAAFHTGFNVVGVLLMTPFIRIQARWLERIIPDNDPFDARPHFLDRHILTVPAAAVQAIDREMEHLVTLTLRAIAFTLDLHRPRPSHGRSSALLKPVQVLAGWLGVIGPNESGRDLSQAKQARDAVESLAEIMAAYMQKVEQAPGIASGMFGLLRSTNHWRSAAAQAVRAARYRSRAARPPHPPEELIELESELAEAVLLLSQSDDPPRTRAVALSRVTARAEQTRSKARQAIFRLVSAGTLSSHDALELADYASQLERVLYDLGRAMHYWTEQEPLSVYEADREPAAVEGRVDETQSASTPVARTDGPR